MGLGEPQPRLFLLLSQTQESQEKAAGAASYVSAHLIGLPRGTPAHMVAVTLMQHQEALVHAGGFCTLLSHTVSSLLPPPLPKSV